MRHLANLGLLLGAVLFAVAAAELPAAIGLVDYRRFIALPQGELFTRIKAWENPRNRLDPELLHIHRSGDHFTGEAAGDLTNWLGIATRRRYPVDVRYDKNGFRNDRDLDTADIVVIGDSFVESGLVPYDSLVSSRLEALLGATTANLGQGGYGPPQERIVLTRYGLPLRPRIVLWLFFEGNDLLDPGRYDRMLRDLDALHAERNRYLQRSFTRNAMAFLKGWRAQRQTRTTSEEARRRSCRLAGSPASGDDGTLYFAYAGAPLTQGELKTLQWVQPILRDARQVSEANGARFVLVLVPTKFRVYHDRCTPPPDGYLREWRPNDLPERLRSWSAAEGMPFLDLTQPLRAAAAASDALVFFSDDGHWNARGNVVAADAIADFVDRSGWLSDRRSGP